MSYFQAKSDLQFVQEFGNAVMDLWKIEDEAAKSLKPRGLSPPSLSEIRRLSQVEASKRKDYPAVRAQVAQGVPRAKRIADRLGLLGVYESYPMPAVGGPVISVTLFDAILHDPTYSGVPKQLIVDALNQTLGACQERVPVEFRHLINPVYWLKELLVFIIRIPFMLFEASGFDVSKIEDHFIGRAFKLVYALILIAILVRWFGVTKEELLQAITALF